MEPLKRFTQCGSLTMLFAVFIVLFGVSSTALTTFGKSPNPPPPPPTPNTENARQCTVHSDCSSIPNTSCVRDGTIERKTRCLCGNNKPPRNGRCESTKKQLRHICNKNDDCDDGMLCTVDTNNTKSIYGNRNQNQPPVCLCNGEEGYTEDVEDNNCNDSSRLLAGVFVPLLSIFLGVIASKRQSTY